MNQIIQCLEAYQLISYAGGVTIALICAWVSNSKLRDANNTLRLYGEDMDTINGNLNEEIDGLKTLLEIQDKHLKTEE